MKLFEILTNSMRRYGDRKAVTMGQLSVTYKELHDHADAIALSLRSYGVMATDHVAIFMNNSIGFIEALFAINRIGAVAVPLYDRTGARKLAEIIHFFHIQYIITTLGCAERLEDATAETLPSLSGIFSLENHQLSKLGPFRLPPVVKAPNSFPEAAFILLSSGTTNIPKGIVLSERNVLSNMQSISEYLGLSSGDIVLLMKNLSHSSSITGELLISLHHGVHIVLSGPILTPLSLVKLVDKYRISVIFSIPPFLEELVSFPGLPYDLLSPLRIIHFYGGHMSYQSMLKLSSILNWVEFIYSYGLTEASPRVTFARSKLWQKGEKCCGVSIKDVEIAICKEKGEVGDDGIGEILVRGPNVMLGYYGNDSLTRKVLRNSYLHTGDLGYLDADNHLFVVGRKDSVINQYAKKIYPEEIESILCTFEGVREALIREEISGNGFPQLIAYIVEDAAHACDGSSLFSQCKLFLEDYKIPKEFRFVDHLQKTPTNKIVRNQEIDIYKAN